jgi:hypothetical protein
LVESDFLSGWLEIGMVAMAATMGALAAYPSCRVLLHKYRSLHPCSTKFRVKHSRINEYLTEVRVKLNADRAVILEFHNGGHFIDGTSMKKFSATHESCSTGVTYTTNRRADLVLTNYVNLVDHIADEVVSIIPSSDLPDSMTRRDLDQHNTLAFSVSSLTNMKNSSTTGCLLIEWCNWDSLDLVQEDEVGVLVKEYTRKISGEMTRG